MTGPVTPEPPDPAEPFEAVAVTLDQEAGQATAARVVSYLYTHISGGPWYSGTAFTYEHVPGLARFDTIPIVRIAEGATDYQREMVHQVVARINRELPYSLHLRIGEDAPALQLIEDIPDNQLFVNFAPRTDWADPLRGRPGALAQAQLDIVHEFDVVQQRREKQRQRAAHVWMESEHDYGNVELFSILMHELLHTLGLPGHVRQDEFPDSAMRDDTLLYTLSVPAIDGAALRAIYTRFPNGTEPEDVSATSLGPWEDTVTNLAGRLDTGGGPVSFGVRQSNGVSIPWTRGSAPGNPTGSTLAENPAITGSASWQGGLLGFTPDNRSVGGNAVLSVDVATMDGRADFTELQSWPAGEAPGAFGTGTQWNTGSLGYTISVSGNLMRSTGGDTGVVSGNFYGRNHEGAAGTIERSDLTAAFGGSR